MEKSASCNRKVYGANIIWSLLSISPRWRLIISPEEANSSISILNGKVFRDISFQKIRKITSGKGLFFSWVSISYESENITLKGVNSSEVSNIINALEAIVISGIRKSVDSRFSETKYINSYIKDFFCKYRYIKKSEEIELRETAKKYLDKVEGEFSDLLLSNYFDSISKAKLTREVLSRAGKVASKTSQIIEYYNDKYIEKELESNKSFFDSIEKSKLTLEQRVSAIIFEDRNLLIAAAGSGKSSTLIGKIGYAIKNGVFKPDEVIALAFNRAAALELNERINKRIAPNLDGVKVKAHTFHALGYNIVRKAARKDAQATGKKPFSRLSYKADDYIRLNKAIQHCLKNINFMESWIWFVTLFKEASPSDNYFSNFKEYDSYIERQRTAKKNSKGLEFVPFKTLSGKLVRSSEELAIANWLFIKGVPFEYESNFDELPDTWNKYMPDFYYPDVNLWHEHFALDGEGKAPVFWEGYAEQAEIKRSLLESKAPGRWFETTSYQYRTKTIFRVIEDKLKEAGQKFSPPAQEDVLAHVNSMGGDGCQQLILDSIHLVKGNMIDRSEFNKRMSSISDKYRADCFSAIFWPIYDEYSAILRESDKQIDFNDMIVEAVNIIEDEAYQSPYKLILVDEFQDISQGRSMLVKALLNKHKDSVLFGVGDDWQAINGFSGSDLKLFMNFEKEFGYTKITKLTKTFRCAQGISDVGAFFIQENRNGQIQKEVISEIDKSIKSVVDIRRYKKGKLRNELILKFDKIVEIAKSVQNVSENADKRVSVYILSRYSLKNTKNIDDKWLTEVQRKYGKWLDIQFMTIHASKGLEADYVFILGMNGGFGYTFPTKFTTDPIIESLRSNKDLYPDAEERRLFYVALTRAKRKVYAWFQDWLPSFFVTELFDEKYDGRVLFDGGPIPNKCDRCGNGYMIKRPGSNGEFLGCSNYPMHAGNCKNTKRIGELA
ncbi:UvrD-helicase domain-containing protein [Hahella sp. HN01]|uniref:UvrD-helicase domain-containing protein n=1 Tax=Hahella sp. HN01 TaxID=2847262 RepID=UPI001C1EB403|nr:UvrD-helicase domain-containing protein [Hahella sp. HN01]MBU6951013.1 UvrD-helicase domain-containing protein [Hahella sp. HN01]